MTCKKIIGFENEKTLPLTNKELKSHEDGKVCCICGKYFVEKLFLKVRDHCHYTEAWRTAFVIQKLMCPMKYL